MSLVLGIDAAWSVQNPSGVALVSAETNPRLIRAAPSFEDFFLGTASDAWCGKHEFRASLSDILNKASEIGGGEVTVISVDMPLALEPILARRCCDTVVSKTFGARGCATHSPTAQRPGKVSSAFVSDAMTAGFTLRTRSPDPGDGRALLEVYPHVALLELCRADFRLPYKLSTRHKNFRDLDASGRLEAVREEWNKILVCLQRRIDLHLEIDCAGKSLRHWKAWEDAIDAVVCCWVGLEWLAGRALAYGNDDAAIWAPKGA